MSKYILDFEKQIKLIEDKIRKLSSTSDATGMDNSESIKILQIELEGEISNTYSNLSRWQKVELARHPSRPHALDFINNITSDWIELHGDRKFADDNSIVSGWNY